ncbi:hypothetical protein OQA88_4457 [Cercophora sp. LCS_1]
MSTPKSLSATSAPTAIQPLDLVSWTTSDSKASVPNLIKDRQEAGYTMVRHRTVTGEVTEALFRGPLSPKPIPHPLNATFNSQSNMGYDLQIQDDDLSMTDITYHTAWQLGRTLALADQSFTAALSRLRMASIKSRVIQTPPIRGNKSREDVLAGLGDLLGGIGLDGPSGDTSSSGSGSSPGNRWSSRTPIPTTQRMIPELGAALDVKPEITIPENKDLEAVCKWVEKKCLLDGIPVHYLLPDPAFLPEGTMRFFYVDLNWADVVVDGALSIANTVGGTSGVDRVREAIEEGIAKWEGKVAKGGFILRSKGMKLDGVVVEMELSAKEENGMNKALAQRKLGEEVLLCLFVCATSDIRSVTIKAEGYAQRFVIGDGIMQKVML